MTQNVCILSESDRNIDNYSPKGYPKKGEYKSQRKKIALLGLTAVALFGAAYLLWQNAKYTNNETIINNLSQMDRRFAKTTIDPQPKTPPPTDQCFPKSGKRHPLDIDFYKHAKARSIDGDERSDVVLYLRSEELIKHPIGNIASMAAATLLKIGRVISRPIQRVGDICKEMNEIHTAGGKIQALIIAAHGTPESIRLAAKQHIQDLFSYGGGTDLTRRNIDLTVKFPKTGCLNHLQPKAPIVLLSCSTAGKDFFGNNVADAFAREAVGHTVYAPKTPIYLSGMKVKVDNGSPSFLLKNPQNKDVTYTANVDPKKVKDSSADIAKDFESLVDHFFPTFGQSPSNN